MHDDIKTIATANSLDAVLAEYALPKGDIAWISHDDIGEDNFVHYFSIAGKKFALVENFHPTETFIHEENLPPVKTTSGKDEWLHVASGSAGGYYSLYEDS